MRTDVGPTSAALWICGLAVGLKFSRERRACICVGAWNVGSTAGASSLVVRLTSSTCFISVSDSGDDVVGEACVDGRNLLKRSEAATKAVHGNHCSRAVARQDNGRLWTLIVEVIDVGLEVQDTSVD